MASIGHVAVGMAAGRAFTKDPKLMTKAMIAFSVVSLLPDADAISFALGIPYEHPFGHRGASHSLAVAVIMAGIAYFVAARDKLPPTRTAVFTGIVAASHGLLDTMTYGGGKGVALLWPFSNERFWAPFRFIPISPIGVHILSERGLTVMLTEVLLFAPFWLYAIWPRRKK